MSIYNEYFAPIIPDGDGGGVCYITERDPESGEILCVSESVSGLSGEDRNYAEKIAKSVQSAFQMSSLHDFHNGRVVAEQDLHTSISGKEVANIATLANALFAVNHISEEIMKHSDLEKHTDEHPLWLKKLVSLSAKKSHGLARAGIIPEDPTSIPDEDPIDYSDINSVVDRLFRRSSVERITGRRSAEAEMFARYEKERRDILRKMSEGENDAPRTREEAIAIAEIETERDRHLDRVEMLRNELTKDMMEADLTDPFAAQSFETRKKEIERQHAAILKEYSGKVSLLHKKRGGDADLEMRLRAIERKQEHLLERQSFRKTYSYYPF